jgi:enoyl-CoA hydratase/carnithine racemase
MSTPVSYSSLRFKDISVSHVHKDSLTPTKVLVLALNRPKKYNAVTENLVTELETVYKLVDSDSRVGAIVLTGNGKVFCAGADLEVGFSGFMAHKENQESIKKFRDP